MERAAHKHGPLPTVLQEGDSVDPMRARGDEEEIVQMRNVKSTLETYLAHAQSMEIPTCPITAEWRNSL